MKNVVLDEMPMEEDYKKFFEENIILQMSIGSEDSSKIDEVVEMLDGRVKKENRFMSSLIPQELDMINIINSSASKGNAILGLCKYLKIKPEEAMAFGDDLNDISMMKSVYGVAMENASDNVKVLAKEITKTNDESGIAEIWGRDS
jgi:hydroxymethylpyrimidine pyrophosphatase-like HAD family hydrolase